MVEEMRSRLAQRCQNRIIHFSSCASLDVAHDEVNDFLDETGASAISGYRKVVPWTEALALDWLYLVEIQTANFVKLTPKLMKEVDDDFDWTSAAIKANFDENVGYLPTSEMRKGLGFNMRFKSVPA